MATDDNDIFPKNQRNIDKIGDRRNNRDERYQDSDRRRYSDPHYENRGYKGKERSNREGDDED